jgi:chemotaxis signal transduction protein
MFLLGRESETTMQSDGLSGYAEPAVAADAAAADGTTETWVTFQLDEQTYALHIWEVERIVRAVEVKPVPESPSHIRGVVNIQGRVLPVVDLRARFGQPTRDIGLDDHFIIANTSTTSVVLPADAALGSLEVSGGFVPHDDDERTRCLQKIVPVDGELIYALDLERVVFRDGSFSDRDFASVLAELEMT